MAVAQQGNPNNAHRADNPAPPPPPAAPPAPTPRPVTPAVAVTNAALGQFQHHAQSAGEDGERLRRVAVNRDNAESDRLRTEERQRQAELEEAERRRQAFWRAVRTVVGILALIGVVAMVTMFIMAKNTTPTTPSAASPTPAIVVTATPDPASPAPSIGAIEINCGGTGVVCTAEDCLWGKGPQFGRNSSLDCCNKIENMFHRTRCLSIRKCLLEHKPGPALDACVEKAGG